MSRIFEGDPGLIFRLVPLFELGSSEIGLGGLITFAEELVFVFELVHIDLERLYFGGGKITWLVFC